MSKSSFFPHVTLCSRLNVCRITLIFGLCLVAYLFIYKIDINATATLARNILTPLSNLDQSNGQIVAQPLIPMTKSVGNIFIPDQKINKVVETTTTTTIPTNDTTTSQNSSIDQQPKEAFVTFSNNAPSYLAVLKVFLDSVHAFSTRPVIAFGIDVDLDIDTVKYPRVIKRRIKQSDCGPVRYKINLIKTKKFFFSIRFSQSSFANFMLLFIVMLIMVF